jgi:hypothetical protein
MNPRVLRVTRPLSLGTPTGDPNIQAPFVFFKIQWLVPPKYIVALLMFAVLTSFFVNRILSVLILHSSVSFFLSFSEFKSMLFPGSTPTQVHKHTTTQHHSNWHYYTALTVFTSSTLCQR